MQRFSHALLALVAVCGVVVFALESRADRLGSGGSYGIQEEGLSRTGGSMSGGVAVSGACASMITGDTCCYDNNGVHCGWPATDTAPQNITILGQSAPPLGSGSTTGGYVAIAGGWGTIQSTAVQANCGAGDTFTLTWLANDNTANTKTCTRDAATDSSTLFTCGASNQAMATNVAACLATATGIGACAGSNCTVASNGFVGVDGNIYVYPASNEPAAVSAKLASNGNHGAVTLGTTGTLLTPRLSLATGAIGTIAASSTYLSQCLANAACVGTPAGGVEAGSILASYLYSRVSGATESYTGGSVALYASDNTIQFNSAATLASGSPDTGISKASPGVVAIGTGANGSTAGTVSAATVTASTGITCTSTGTISWTKQTAANQACTTTCVSACVFGQDSATKDIVDCSDATADVCYCAGAS